MIHYKPYPTYKDSGVEWLGEVPEGWGVLKVGALFEETNTRGGTKEDLLAVSQSHGIMPQNDYASLLDRRLSQSQSEDYSNYKCVGKGEFVYNKMRMWQGAIGFSLISGCVSPAYVTFKPKEKQVPFYWNALFKTNGFLVEVNRRSQGICDDQNSCSFSRFREIYILVPPLSEQNAIQQFLQKETTRIDTLVLKKTRFIELLKEKRQALITHAVTKGLDPNVKMKDSGVEAVGKVPEHWDIQPLKSVVKLTKEMVGSLSKNFSLLSLTRRGIINRDTSENFGKFPESFDTYQIVRPGNFVLCLFDIDETPRTVGVSSLYGMITGAYSVFLCESNTYRNYLYYMLLHLDDVKGLKPYYTGLRKTIRPSKFLNIRFPFPPKEEAKKICEEIDTQTSRIDTLIGKIQHSIELLKDRRSALITAAVTGKIDVRGNCTNMPSDAVEVI